MLIIITLIIRYYIRKAMRIPEQLYKTALQQENNGLFQEAQAGYQYAMQEICTKKFQSRRLKNMITEKLKTLRDVIAYSNSQTLMPEMILVNRRD